MRIGEIYRESRFGLSIEIFPPKTTQGDDGLLRALDRLSKYQPDFISCTYGAGGTTRDRTIEWCSRIQERYGLSATAHFTCVGSTRGDLYSWLDRALESGITNIMALRGDAPQGNEGFQPVDGGLQYANELVSLIREKYPDVGIGVAGYPETHVEAPDAEIDLKNLKRKVDAGADAVFTQLFYSNGCFFDFQERCGRAGIDVPLVPGIMPITEFARIERITSMCGAGFPQELRDRLEAVSDDKGAQFEIGVEHAVRQCEELIAHGVPGIHFYVLNRSKACERILNALGMGPPQADCA